MSPAATLSHDDAEALALDAADDLFYRRGVASVPMADIRDRSGVSLRRLYGMFPSKAALVTAWLRHRHQTWMAGFLDEHRLAMAAGSDPVDAVFDALSRWMEATGYRGCGFINTHAESHVLTDDHLAVIQMHKRSLADALERLTGHGAALAVVVDGAIVQAAIHRSPEPIESARAVGRALAKEKS